MSRPGVWRIVWMNFKKSLTAHSTKNYVGEDVHGNRYYEVVGKRKSVMRGYEAKSEFSPDPSVNWLAWLKGIRKFPPSNVEAEVVVEKQQTQFIKDTEIERKAPRVETSKGPADAPPSIAFPRYPDLEDQPGVSKQ